MKSFFLSYTDADGVPPFFQLLDGQTGYDLVIQSAQIIGRVTTRIQNEGSGTDPILEIAAITNKRVSQEEASGISQSAVNWLMENGHLDIRQ